MFCRKNVASWSPWMERKIRRERALAQLSGIEQVVTQSAASAERGITLALDVAEAVDRSEVAAAVAKTVHEQGWPLYAIGYEAKDLESVFSQFSRD